MSAVKVARPHRLAPRAGEWVVFSTSGMGGIRCDCCDRDAERGWGFRNAGQVRNISAFVCDECAKLIGAGR